MPSMLLLVGLCLIEGSIWLTAASEQGPFAYCFVGLVSCVAIAVSSIPLAAHRPAALQLKTHLKLTLCGAAAFGIPATLLVLARAISASQDATAILVGVPLVVGLVSDVRGPDQESFERVLLPGLAGLAGAMLVTPVGLPASSMGWSGFCLDLLSAILVGAFGVYLHRLAVELPSPEGLLWISVGNAVVYGCATLAFYFYGDKQQIGLGFVPSDREGLAFIAGLASIQALGFVLVRQLSPIQFSSRFAFVPVVALIEGFVLWRPTISGRVGVGGVLMICSAGALLRRGRQSQTAIARFIP